MFGWLVFGLWPAAITVHTTSPMNAMFLGIEFSKWLWASALMLNCSLRNVRFAFESMGIRTLRQSKYYYNKTQFRIYFESDSELCELNSKMKKIVIVLFQLKKCRTHGSYCLALGRIEQERTFCVCNFIIFILIFFINNKSDFEKICRLSD